MLKFCISNNNEHMLHKNSLSPISLLSKIYSILFQLKFKKPLLCSTVLLFKKYPLIGPEFELLFNK